MTVEVEVTSKGTGTLSSQMMLMYCDDEEGKLLRKKLGGSYITFRT